MRLLLIILLFCVSSAFAQHIDWSGMGRVRSTQTENYDFDADGKDAMNQTNYRFQLGIKASKTKDSKTHVFFQPRFNKTAGSWTEGDATTASSGSLANETQFSVHQSYIGHKFNKRASMTVGRQELNYGDQVLLGGVGWHNVGRAFDGYRVHYDSKVGRTDAFSMTVKEVAGDADSDRDHDLNGIYHSGKMGKVKNIDVYYLVDQNLSNATNTMTNIVTAMGFRVKSDMKNFDYRVEYVSESIKMTDPDDAEEYTTEAASMYDVELGYTFGKFRIAVESSSASEYFNDLYPTAHKWLGYADLFRRKNIAQTALHASYQAHAKTKVLLDYHQFSRVAADEDSNTNFQWGSPAVTADGNEESDLGTEIDLTINHQLDKDLSLQVVYATFTPGTYFDENDELTDALTSTYLQLLAKF